MNFQSMGSYARHLFDVFYLYGMAVSKLNSTDPTVYGNLNLLMPQMVTSFDGMSFSNVYIYSFTIYVCSFAADRHVCPYV